jgi:hypothetical protein
MLLKRMLTAKRAVALVTLENVSWRVEMLIERLLTAKRSVTFITLEY